jgi:hypothetical protein
MSEPRALRFTEEMKGWLSFDQTDFNQALLHGRREGTRAKLRLTIEIADLARFLDPARTHEARAHGHLECDALGGRLETQAGGFELFSTEGGARHLRMRYRLALRNPAGYALTLHGFKLVEDDPNFDSWHDVTTLFVRLHAGHVDEGAQQPDEPVAPDGPVATGVLRVTPFTLARQLMSYRGRLSSVNRFQAFFLRELARGYRGRPLTDTRPSFPHDRGLRAAASTKSEAVDGRPLLRRRVVPYVTEDGFELNLHHLTGRREPDRGPVLLSPGASLRAEVFYGQPSGRTIVDVLLDEGYDVWVQNWRGGIDFPPNDYSLDRVAVYDHPAAVEAVLRETTAKTVKAIVHCQGSASFTMAAVAGLVPSVTHVVSSALSLHVRVPPQTRIKQLFMLPAIAAVTPYGDAQWGIRPPSPPAALLAAYTRVVRNECDNPVCRTASYMYGTGPDVLWRHDNVDPDVHRWMGREIGFAPIPLLRQLTASVGADHMIRYENLPQLPADYVAQPPHPDAPTFTFLVGKQNRMFLPQGQRESFEYFDSHQPGRHDFHVFDGVGHLDMFLGRDAPTKTFPEMLNGLER